MLSKFRSKTGLSFIYTPLLLRTKFRSVLSSCWIKSIKKCGKFHCFHEDAPNKDDTLSGAAFCIPITAFLASETHIAYAATAIASALQAVHSCLELPHGFLQRGAGAGGVQAHEARKAVSEGISLIQAQFGLVDEEVPQFLVGHA